jgi:hypothetical protein
MIQRQAEQDFSDASQVSLIKATKQTYINKRRDGKVQAHSLYPLSRLEFTQRSFPR